MRLPGSSIRMKRPEMRRQPPEISIEDIATRIDATVTRSFVIGISIRRREVWSQPPEMRISRHSIRISRDLTRYLRSDRRDPKVDDENHRNVTFITVECLSSFLRDSFRPSRSSNKSRPCFVRENQQQTQE